MISFEELVSKKKIYFATKLSRDTIGVTKWLLDYTKLLSEGLL